MTEQYDGIRMSDDPEETVIWRYINFYQLVSILNRDALYFCRVDRFSDPFEGSLPKPEAEKDRQVEEAAEVGKFYRKAIFANCWHINEHESASMWNQYSTEGIAIKSNMKDLKDSFSVSNKGVNIYEVRYIDYENDKFDSQHRLKAYFHKRLSYKHEQEVRLLFHDTPPHDGSEYAQENNVTPNDIVLRETSCSEDMLVDGYFHQFDIDVLIDEIRINPSQNQEFKELVKAELQNHGYTMKVRMSDMNKDPVF